MRRIDWLADEVLVSQEGLRSFEFASQSVSQSGILFNSEERSKDYLKNIWQFLSSVQNADKSRREGNYLFKVKEGYTDRAITQV